VGGADISAAGTSVGTLQLSGNVDELTIWGEELAFDDVVFVPEPGTGIMIMLGGSFLLRWRRKNR